MTNFGVCKLLLYARVFFQLFVLTHSTLKCNSQFFRRQMFPNRQLISNYATTKNRTSVSRVAPTRYLRNDALLFDLYLVQNNM